MKNPAERLRAIHELAKRRYDDAHCTQAELAALREIERLSEAPEPTLTPAAELAADYNATVGDVLRAFDEGYDPAVAPAEPAYHDTETEARVAQTEFTLKALANMGHDVKCGACMMLAFTGQCLAGHTCARPAEPAPVEPSVPGWIPVSDDTPVSTTLIGYDRFYGRVGECYWEPGRRCDDGTPGLVFVDSDDCYITHWYPMPEAPPGKQEP